MTQKDKELLLKDLCARLTCEVKVDHFGTIKELLGIMPSSEIVMVGYDINDYEDSGIEDIKPYLRPIPSMAEKEFVELSNIISEWFNKELYFLIEEPFLGYTLSRINYSISPLLFDWLNAHHFDYRGLIPKGLAIEVTKENNPYKD